jgi:hypothetical protein
MPMRAVAWPQVADAGAGLAIVAAVITAAGFDDGSREDRGLRAGRRGRPS